MNDSRKCENCDANFQVVRRRETGSTVGWSVCSRRCELQVELARRLAEKKASAHKAGR